MSERRGGHHRSLVERLFGLGRFLLGSPINWLLVFAPISWGVALLGFSGVWLFITSVLAIIPLAHVIGMATEQLARRVGPAMGGLVTATFGNATELIIGIIALRAGLLEVVKASISGSIIANVLLVLGSAMLVGGWGRQRQNFNRTRAGASSAMLFLAVVALIMPAIFDLSLFGSLQARPLPVDEISLLVAIVLMATYIAGLVFSLLTHRELIARPPVEPQAAGLGIGMAILALAVATALVALEAQLLVGSIDAATAALGMTQFFVGVVVVGVVGSAAEYFTAVLMASRNRMELAVTVATGAATQVALFVAPILVFVSFIFGQPMSLVFNVFEIAGITLAVLALAVVALDGESNWFEGLQLVAVYSVLAIVFYFVPA